MWHQLVEKQRPGCIYLAYDKLGLLTVRGKIGIGQILLQGACACFRLIFCTLLCLFQAFEIVSDWSLLFVNKHFNIATVSVICFVTETTLHNKINHMVKSYLCTVQCLYLAYGYIYTSIKYTA